MEFNFTAVDSTGMTAKGMTLFFGQSIIFEEITTGSSLGVLNPSKLAQLELIYHEMVENGLIDLTIKTTW